MFKGGAQLHGSDVLLFMSVCAGGQLILFAFNRQNSAILQIKKKSVGFKLSRYSYHCYTCRTFLKLSLFVSFQNEADEWSRGGQQRLLR